MRTFTICFLILLMFWSLAGACGIPTFMYSGSETMEIPNINANALMILRGRLSQPVGNPMLLVMPYGSGDFRVPLNDSFFKPGVYTIFRCNKSGGETVYAYLLVDHSEKE